MDNTDVIKRIDTLETNLNKKFDDVWERIDKDSEVTNKLKTASAVRDALFEKHEKDDAETKKNFGTRLGNIESHPALKGSDNWKWLLGVLGFIYVALQIFDKVKGYIK